MKNQEDLGNAIKPVYGEAFYALCVETKTAIVLGGGGITGGMYELGTLSALDDFIVFGWGPSSSAPIIPGRTSL